jgi:hypothetical protein
MSQVIYTKGFDYHLLYDFYYQTDIFPLQKIVTEYIELNTDGWLFVRKGFYWDGASGPTVDTKSTIRASLVHDALYWLIRNGYLSNNYRDKADLIFKNLLVNDYKPAGLCKGLKRRINKLRAFFWWRGVRRFGIFAVLPKYEKAIKTAP